ncbi:MAG: hypothetical protein IAE95_12410 [Chitinophagaceae bacterium]|nr:hypothetical protein [Chitinophagaceae bacterium]
MDKKQLLNVVDSILLPLGYKRKNSRWQLVEAVVTKGPRNGVVSDYVIAVANLRIGEDLASGSHNNQPQQFSTIPPKTHYDKTRQCEKPGGQVRVPAAKQSRNREYWNQRMR